MHDMSTADSKKTGKSKSSEEAAKPEQPKKGGSKMLIIIIAAVVLLGGGGAAAFFMMKGGDKDKKPEAHEEVKAAAVYVPLDPPFTVNFENVSNARFLQIAVQLMTRDPKAVEEVKVHMPAIRNDLLLLFGQQTAAGLSNVEGKEKLRAEALETVRTTLGHEGIKPETIEGLYFTTLVMQ
jgi:flagellar FliL protein